VPTSTPIAHTGPGRGDDLSREPELHAPGDGDPPVRAVLVGVDGGECALAAVRWAGEEAQRRRAPLRIVHAAPYLGRRIEPGTPSPELHRARQITGQAYTVARHTAADVHAETEVVPDEPVRVLLAEAPEADLVVLGIATTGAIDELVAAPVAQRVAAKSGTPVVVVPRSRAAVPDDRPVAAVLGLGEPDDDEAVVEFAATTARRSGSPLVVVRLHGRPGGADVDWAGRYTDLAVTTQEVPGGTPRDLLKAVCPTPLMVLAAGHGNLLHRSLDGTHRYLLRHCTSPMALIPPVNRSQADTREEDVAAG
jgi:nucleotide-binding universal stress UspA family protein